MAASTLTEADYRLCRAKTACETAVGTLVRATGSLTVAFYKADQPHLALMHLGDAEGGLRKVAQDISDILALAAEAKKTLSEVIKDGGGDPAEERNAQT